VHIVEHTKKESGVNFFGGKKMKKLFILLLLLGVTSIASAVGVTTTWRTVAQGRVSSNWLDPCNWSAGLPTNEAGNSTTLYNSAAQADGPIINGLATALAIRDGGIGGPLGTTAHLTMQSGTLTVGDFLLVAPDSTTGGGRNGMLHMEGGTINLLTNQGRLGIGNGADGNPIGSQNITGTLDMTGGNINAKTMYIGANLTKGIATISGGTIDLIQDFWMRPNALNPNVPSLTISGTGEIIITGDLSARVLGYKDVGWINDEVQISLTRNPGRTTLFVPEPATICLLGIGALSLLRRRK
jgi:hypothetical protein